MPIRGRPLPLPELFLGLLSIGVAVVLTAKIVAGTIHDARHIHDTISVTGSFPPAPPGSSNSPPRSSSRRFPRPGSTRPEPSWPSGPPCRCCSCAEACVQAASRPRRPSRASAGRWRIR